MPPSLNRRQLLGLGGVAAFGAVAGCDRSPPPRADWQLRLAAGTNAAPKSIGFLGDSITFGAGAPPNGNSLPKFRWCYPGQLRTLLEPAYGNGGTGWVLMNRDLWPVTRVNRGWDPRLVVTGPIRTPDAGPFGRSCFTLPKGPRSGPTSYVEFTAAGSTFSTLVLAKPDGRSRQLVSIDGGTPIALRNTAGGSADIAPRAGTHPRHVWTDVPTGSGGTHTMRVWGRGDAVDLLAVRATTGTGRLVIDVPAVSGESLRGFLGGPSSDETTAYAGLPYLDTFAFDLLVVALGTNDYNEGRPLDAVRTDLTAVVNRQRAGGRDVALCFPPISAPQLYPGAPAPSYDDYASLYAAVAADLAVPFLDLTHLWGRDFAAADAAQPQKYADHVIHPSDDGAHDIAGHFQSFLAL